MEFVAAAIGIGKGIAGIFGAKSQKKIDRKQIQLQYEDNLEKIRRREFDQEQTLGQSKLLTEASGVRHTGGSTAQGFIDVMSSEFKKELDWMQQYADRSRSIGNRRASAAQTTGILNSVFSGINAYGTLSG